MFTDMVGYTALGQRNESLSLALVEEQRKVIRPILVRHDGREVKTMGDAFLVEFHNAVEAVRCAYDIQRAVREFNLSVAIEKRIHLRIGIHVGEIVESDGDVSGDTVNVASRIEPLAEDGGVCVTQHVYDFVQGKVDLLLTSAGPKTLKNVIAPVEVYKMVMPWEAQQAQNEELDPKRVAVLPFTNMSPDPNDQYFSDGMTEELISALSRVKGLGVISRTSVMPYKSQNKGLKEIARELNVGTLIEGSVRKAGNRIRIAVQLIDAGTDNHLWAENYERNLDDIFAIQSEVAMKVSRTLEGGVFTLPHASRDTTNMSAYTLYLRAMQLSHQDDEPGLKEAIELFEKAISIDRGFVRAYLGEALAWTGMATGGYSDMSTLSENAEVKALSALELDPDSAEVHATLAVIYSLLDRFEKSRLEAHKAVEMNPNVAEAHYSLGMDYATLGDLETALVYFKKAYALDPLSSHTADFLALVLRTAGNIDESKQVLEKLKELYPRNPKVYLGVAECHLLRREFASAQESLDEGLSINPDEPRLRIDQGVLYALTGRKSEALRVLAGLQQDKSPSVRAYSRLFIRAALGDNEEAMETLMHGVETHTWPFLIKTLPIFDELRKHPKFGVFCSKMGI